MKQNIINGQTNQPVYIREDSEEIKRIEFEIQRNTSAIQENANAIQETAQSAKEYTDSIHDDLQEQIDNIEIDTSLFVNVVERGADPTGVLDSTAAIQDAVDYLNDLSTGECHNARIFFPAGTYLMNGTVTLYQKYNFVLDASATTIKYTGNSYPFELIRCFGCEFRFGEIDARKSTYWSEPYSLPTNVDTSGGCIIINATMSTINPTFTRTITDSSTEFINIYFDTFYANDDQPCVYCSMSNDGYTEQWIGDIKFYNGRFRSGYGIYTKEHTPAVKTPPGPRIDGIRCINCTFTGTYDRPLTCGIRCDAAAADVTRNGTTYELWKTNLGCYACRHGEAYVTLLDFASDGFDTRFDDFTWVGSSLFNVVYNRPDITGESNTPTLKFTTKTYGKVIADIYDYDGRRIDKSATIVCGELIPDTWNVLLSTWGTTDLRAKHGWEVGKFIRYTESTGINTLTLPRFYLTRNGVNDFRIIFENAHTNFALKVDRGLAEPVTVRTISSIEAGTVLHFMLEPYNYQTQSSDYSNQKVYIVKEDLVSQ